eukprot:TRINITY_DN5431_c0_g1_i3.p1 TRINITY_DN5431_c0_g1~~TRINITY_DN5431_c0_g1_i3.p1  ORF type:complete len:1082 (+),score=283.02 TRINITY_DN5431_c0_g1_i3:209-3454(+)
MSLRYEQLAPGEGENVRQQKSREERAPFLSRVFFHWTNPLIRLGHKRILLEDDLDSFPYEQSTKKAEQDFEALFEQKKRTVKRAPLLRTFVSFGAKAYAFGAFLKLTSCTCSLFQPLVLKLLLDWLQNPETQAGREHVGFLLAFGLLFGAIGQAYAVQHLYWVGFLDGLRFRQSLMMGVLKKLLRLTASTKRTISTGTMTNLVSVDSQRIMDFVWNPHDWWAAVIFAIANIAMLFYLIGLSTFAGIGALFLLVPFNTFVVKTMVGYQEKFMGTVDGRISKVTELLEGIKLIKLYNWEECFKGRINEYRETELSVLKKIAYLRATSAFSWTLIPAVVSLAVFVCFALTGGILTPALAFSVLSVINNLRDPIGRGVEGLHTIMQAWISTKRIDNFFGLEEVEIPNEKEDKEYALSVNGDFAWERSEEGSRPTLEGLNFRVPHGQLVLVVGAVGSGKTSLLGTILGEVKKLAGDIDVCGKVVHTTQAPWLMNATLRDNITFFRPFDKEKYEKTIHCSALVRDLQQLPGGDQTEIGERGVNLSGGQKQRLALARAVYRHDEADIYLFDEPLGAVDPAVADKIFHECIMGVLRPKTRILVTHQLQFLPFADKIYVMKNGRIEHQGTYTELMESGVDFASILKTRAAKLQRIRSTGSMSNLLSAEKKAEEKSEKIEEKERTKLIQDEERDMGGVDTKLYFKYFGAGSKWLFFFVFSLYIIAQAAKVGSDYWLVWWSSGKWAKSNAFYMGIYAAWFAGYGILVLIRERTLAFACLLCARILHGQMLNSTVRSPMSFFDSTPLGRILNRFSKDQEVIDSRLTSIISDIGICGSAVASIVIVICVLSPWLTIPMAGIIVVYFFVQRYYRSTARELKRMEAVSKSPIFSYFSEAVSGVSIIRVYGAEDEYFEEFRKRIDHNTRIFYWHFATNRWLGLRLESISCAVVFATALVDVISSRSGSLSTALIGLSISYTLAITSSLNWTVRQWTELEISMNAVSRVIDYTELEPEAPLISEDYDTPHDWPSNGDIKFNNLCLRYANTNEDVLKGITCAIEGKEKIGKNFVILRFFDEYSLEFKESSVEQEPERVP